MLRSRNARHILVGLAAGGMCFFNGIPLLFPQQTVKRVYQSYKDGEERQLSMKSGHEFDQVCYDLSIKDREKYHLFASYGTNICTSGTRWLPNGLYIGIPDVFSMQRPSEVVASNMQIGRERIDWESECGKSLAESLILSENARKFYIARELIEANSIQNLIPTFVAPVFIVASYVVGEAMKYLVHFIPGLATVGCACVGLVCYFGISGVVQNRTKTLSDRKVAMLGPEYKEGGLEFYQNLLTRNKNLRSILGKKGIKRYSYYGNEHLSVFNFSPVLTERLKTISQVKVNQQIQSEDV
ncbi:transmembrane protein 177-like [Saccoglossus kowalevskii]|uniref:Transmembrane protein 177-like n=1 Tax=Saccoglossus kowalevskii TaxID=10224 RepID=A0ABM0H0F1_SACKO|nr:PREDICTED: transmembrane protein 177-like [Saccoglossus kowalevskii]